MASYTYVAVVALLVCVSSLGSPRCLAQTTDCNTAATQSVPKILPCQGYVMTGNSTVPGPECCTPLTEVVKDVGDECFCTFSSSLQSFAASMPTLNQTRAMELPALCKISLPPQAASCLAASNSTTNSTTAPASGPSPGVSGSTSSNTAPVPDSHAQHTMPSYAIFSLSILALCLHSLVQ